MQYISKHRLNSYHEILEISEQYSTRAYHWNKLICGAIHPAIQTVEVTLRNAINSMVLKHHHYYKDNEWWFLNILPDNNKIESKIQRWKDGGLSANDCIGKLNFGFWLSFFRVEYFDTNDNERALWGKNCLGKYIFPNEKHVFSYERTYTAIEKIKNIRNRIAHNEPVWKMNKQGTNDVIYGLNACLEELRNRYNTILKIIKYIDKETHQNFIGNGLRINFDMLITKDGFWSIVNTNKVRNSAFLHQALSNKYYLNKKDIPDNAEHCPSCLYKSFIIQKCDLYYEDDCKICDRATDKCIYINCDCGDNILLEQGTHSIGETCRKCNKMLSLKEIEEKITNKYTPYIGSESLSIICPNYPCENDKTILMNDNETVICRECYTIDDFSKYKKCEYCKHHSTDISLHTHYCDHNTDYDLWRENIENQQ